MSPPACSDSVTRGQGPVIYIAAEAGAGIINRIAAWRQASGISELHFAALASQIDLCHPASDDLDRLLTAILAVRFNAEPVLVIVDTLSRVLAGGNENSPDDMGGLVRSLDRLRDTLHCHVLGVHHVGKDATRGARGHSLLHCAADTEIEVVRDNAPECRARRSPSNGTDLRPVQSPSPYGRSRSALMTTASPSPPA